LVAWEKKKINSILETIPLLSKLVVDNLIKNFDKNGHSLLNNLNGVIGITVKLFGQQLLDRYFDSRSEKKLDNYGLQVYLLGACEQVEESLKYIDDVELDLSSRTHVVQTFEEILKEKQSSIEKLELSLYFIPQKHPAIVLVRNVCEEVLGTFLTSSNKGSTLDSFVKHFNSNIEKKVKVQFGDEYEKHLKEVEEVWTKTNLGQLLTDMKELEKIGFLEEESIKYQETFAFWNEVENYREFDVDNKYIENEDELFPIEELINVYFGNNNDNIDKLLFVVADFGKGKSVMLKQLASKHAKRFEQRGDCAIPLYFNLRDFDSYNLGSTYGVISDYLSKKYGIDVEEDDFQQREYLFLIDSLDECGSLTEDRVDKVISSVKKIQNINPVKCRKNRIIISSRPIEHGLKKHMNSNSPYIIKNKENRPISYYISIYGFKKYQFNDLILDSLRRAMPLIPTSYDGLSKHIISAINDARDIDIYSTFLKEKLLSKSELKRPIFAYMIYKLILNKADLSYSNKVGIYLSFINVLTKEAKYINEVKNINIKDEFRFRNVLHATSALWMYETHRNGQGFLKKHDISNTIDGSVIQKTDLHKMQKYQEVEEVEFLSQSYFGQQGDTFYFQHQSFAEILLAEYYLKLFLHYSLDESANIDEIRIRLFLGNPTEQTIDFLVGLLQLLRETVGEKSDETTLKKRRLLFPALASLCTSEYSKGLYSQYIKYRWYDTVRFDLNSVEPPQSLLENWIITDEVISKVIKLSLDILGSKSRFLLTNIYRQESSLFKNEVVQISDELNQIPPDIDKWLALLVGNTLLNDESKKVFFTSEIREVQVLFSLLKNWNNYTGNAAPTWGTGLFRGLMVNPGNETTQSFILQNLNLSKIDFSYSQLNKLTVSSCDMFACNFKGATLIGGFLNEVSLNSVSFVDSQLVDTTISLSRLWGCNFENISSHKLSIEVCEIDQGVMFPHELSQLLCESEFVGLGLVNFGGKSYFGDECNNEHIDDIIRLLEPFLKIVTKQMSISGVDIKSWFIFSNEENERFFEKRINEVLGHD
jgi:hypothetical protein